MDTHAASFVALGQGYLGTFQLQTPNQTQDTVGWSLGVPAAELNALSHNETLVQQYAVTVADDKGGSFTHTMTVELRGTPDAPVITSTTGATNQRITESPEPEVEGTIHSVSGTFSFTDVDTLDTHRLTVTRGEGFQGGTFSYVVDETADIITWTYSVADSALDSLTQSDSIAAFFDVRLVDSGGLAAGTTPTSVFIRIQGTNDMLVFAGGDMSGTIEEPVGTPATTLSTSGSFDWTDADAIYDRHFHEGTFVAREDGYVGTFTLIMAGNANWRFSVSGLTVDELAAGETLTQYYDVTITDHDIPAFTETVTVTIVGRNDNPTLRSLDVKRVDEHQSVTGSALTYVTDIDRDVLTIASVDGVATDVGVGVAGDFGVLTMSANGQYTYLAELDAGADIPSGQSRFDEFLVEVSDGHGGTVEVPLTFQVLGVNDII